MKERNKMSETQQAMRIANAKLGIHVIQFLPGSWGYVGSVPARLAFVQANGMPATDEQIERARKFGPGIVGLQTRTWESKEAAEAAL